jgi:penicillin-binding protein 1B
MANSGTLQTGHGIPRTVVLYPPFRSLRTRTIEIWRRLPAPIRAAGAWIVKPQIVIVLSIVLTAFCATVVYYYLTFAHEIDARLNKSSLDDAVEIVSAPLRVSLGNRLPIDELTDYLRAIGYQQRSISAEENLVGSFEVDRNSVIVLPGDSAIRQAGAAPVRIQTDSTGKVTSLTSVMTGEGLGSTSIEGELLVSVRNGDRRKRIPVQFSDIPENLKNAIVAAEDRRFFSHSGIDWRGIIRALKTDIDQGDFVQGGSTLTQQLIKNDFLTADRTISRKVKEAAMAIILELRLSKEQIFTHYCNGVYLGQSGTYAVNGFAQASQVYFDKDLNELTLAQCAFLAGLVCGPNRYSAHRDQARALERRNLVLDAMVQTEAITQGQADAAKAEPLQIKKHETEDDNGVSYFVDYTQRFIDERYGARAATQKRITTTLDPRLQQAAYAALKTQTAKLDKVLAKASRKGTRVEPVQAAFVALDAHNGEVLAMVGGRSYDESQLNRATDAKRQPGSAFKPFVYATALRSGFTPASIISDSPQTFVFDNGRSEYKPSDYHGGFTNRKVMLREALARSLNVPAVELAMSTGLSRVADLAETCGLDRPRIYPSMALGTSEVTPLQLASAYTAFANDGISLRPTPIRTVTSGAAANEYVKASGATAFSAQVAYLMTNLMQAVVDEGTASKLRAMGLKGAIAGKTGTSSDGWFVGYTPNIVCVAWVGFDDNHDLGMKASDAALPMWADFMKRALEIRPELGGNAFRKPGGIITVEIDPSTGCLAAPDSPIHKTEIFIAGTEPKSQCYSSSEDSNTEETANPEDTEQQLDDSRSVQAEESQENKVTVELCSLTGLLASPYCPTTEKRTFSIDKAPKAQCSADFHR